MKPRPARNRNSVPGGTMPLITPFIVALLLIAVPASASAMNLWDRFWSDLLARPDGPMAFRFVLQPVMASIAACHDGVKDAVTGRSPYFWTVLSNADERRGRLREGLQATAKILAIGLAMDLAYQLIVFQRIYPLEAIVIALLLAFVPYLLLRGPVARIARWRRTDKPEKQGKTP